jgi:transposase-like protein
MNLLEFQERFATEEDCIAYLIEQRWPEGYVCQECGSIRAGYHSGHRRFQCKDCYRQKSVTADTMFHRSHTPLKEWFLAIYLMSQSKKGISTLELQRLLGAKDYRRVAHMQALIRQAFGSREQMYQLSGFVQVDDVLFGGVAHTGKRGPALENKTRVVVALSLDESGEKPEYVKMEVVRDKQGKSLSEAVEKMVVPGSCIWTDGCQSYNKLPEKGYRHTGFLIQEPSDCQTHFPWLNTIIGNVKRFILGTHHSVKPENLQTYLDEFCYRFNRRFFSTDIFQRTFIAALVFTPQYLRP